MALEGIVEVYTTPLAKIFIFDDFRANLNFKRKIIYFKFTINKRNYGNALREKSNPRLRLCTCSWRAVALIIAAALFE